MQNINKAMYNYIKFHEVHFKGIVQQYTTINISMKRLSNFHSFFIYTQWNL